MSKPRPPIGVGFWIEIGALFVAGVLTAALFTETVQLLVMAPLVLLTAFHLRLVRGRRFAASGWELFRRVLPLVVLLQLLLLTPAVFLLGNQVGLVGISAAILLGCLVGREDLATRRASP